MYLVDQGYAKKTKPTTSLSADYRLLQKGREYLVKRELIQQHNFTQHYPTLRRIHMSLPLRDKTRTKGYHVIALAQQHLIALECGPRCFPNFLGALLPEGRTHR